MSNQNIFSRGIVLLLFVIASLPLSAQSDLLSFWQDVDRFLVENVEGNGVKYSTLKGSEDLHNLISFIESTDYAKLGETDQKAYLINAYNLMVIYKASKNYPLNSVQEVNNFFDRKDNNLGGQKVSLNHIEKELLIGRYNDPRLHFVLVCGANGCPPITNKAYRPTKLEFQLEKQTKMALNNPDFIFRRDNSLHLSQIFDWYKSDFGSSKAAIIEFINEFSEVDYSPETKISHYPYDWSLNSTGSMKTKAKEESITMEEEQTGNSAIRYVVSAAIAKGTWEFKIFNNLYSQRRGEGEAEARNNFFTTTLSSLYGLTNRFNLGLNVKYRKVSNHVGSSSPFSVFGSSDPNHRSGITGIGPMVRFAPIEAWSNFSIQSTFTFGIGDNLEGQNGTSYIDWDGPIWNTQFFNDFTINDNFSLFTEIDFLIEDIGGSDEHLNRASTPVTAIFSYFPAPKVTVYALGNFSPRYQSNFNYFYQFGMGSKYQLSPSAEVELLWTYFDGTDLQFSNGSAATYNLGFRFNL